MMTTLLPVFTKPSSLAFIFLRPGRICRFLLIPDGRIR
ncbi:hypothetical protein PS042_01190 [Escherichia albertii]|uniref:Uncharacterized protein n=1 Tax=Escherichia albertii TaxID=208962 RepID=A0AAX3MMY2_ESCAL|nr:hypothetical protein [Escherichia albertii]MCJ2199401.1 hypothetical protein [Escherichia albertii NBRC 107761 = DSM 17582]MCQ8908616.1 hypothetical protein [Escherichia albertii]MCQ8912327.1 hypothetical protein [Escherichia albertii]MCQ8917343.1 hypothetical protein [Escherichia albertii]MCQ8920448.1 hypothetical protein [Escherichia albertii]